MKTELWHQTIASEERASLFPDEETVRTCVRALGRVVADRLLLFCLVDDRVRQLTTGSRDDAGRVAQSVSLALKGRAAAAFERTHTRAVQSRGHLRSLVDFFLRQTPHHNPPVHPALWSGSCFLDLIGARVIDGLTLRLGRWLPRLRLREVYAAVGLPPRPIALADDKQLRRLGAFRIAQAAGAALAVGPGLTGKDRATVLARTSTAVLAERSGISRPEVADALEITLRAARRLVARADDASVLRAVRTRLALEEIVAAGGLNGRYSDPLRTSGPENGPGHGGVRAPHRSGPECGPQSRG